MKYITSIFVLLGLSLSCQSQKTTEVVLECEVISKAIQIGSLYMDPRVEYDEKEEAEERKALLLSRIDSINKNPTSKELEDPFYVHYNGLMQEDLLYAPYIYVIDSEDRVRDVYLSEENYFKIGEIGYEHLQSNIISLKLKGKEIMLMDQNHPIFVASEVISVTRNKGKSQWIK